MTVWYMNGAGNSFAVIDARNADMNFSKLAKILCEKGNCDGFMALDYSAIADIKLHFYNRDGSRAEMCGNGARCICRFAYDNGIVDEQMTVETDSGVVEGARLNESFYRIKLNAPKDIEICDGFEYVVVGVPHVVIELEDIDLYSREELLVRARELREKKNANVNFYSVLDRNTVKILTYERGVENFTLACGTGSAAVAVVLWAIGELDSYTLVVENTGGTLRVLINPTPKGNIEFFLDGNAVIDNVDDI